MKHRVDIGVGGRFHADRLFAQLSQRDWEPHLYTSFPRSKFPTLSKAQVHPLIWGELVFRASRKVGLDNWGDLYKMRSFGKAMARQIHRQGHSATAFIGWSSFALETFRQGHAETNILVRDSTHIQFQNRILRTEYGNLGVPWPDRKACEERELEEYERADHILVLSQLARETFVAEGIDPQKIHVVPLGLDLSRFSPKPNTPPSLPLKVVYFGSLSLRKGVHYLLEATAGFAESQVELTLIGGAEPHFHSLLKKHPQVRNLGPQPQTQLAESLKGFDVYVFPTLEDGFGQTLPQAMATGLVPIVTENCGSKDFVVDGENGFRVPIRDPGAIRRRLMELTDAPEQLSAMGEKAALAAASRTWDQYGEDFNALLESASTQKHQPQHPQS